jgi:hypothetical protein
VLPPPATEAKHGPPGRCAGRAGSGHSGAVRQVQEARLPFHNRDPFDRLLVAQALEERLALVSRNELFEAYGVERIW